MAVVLSLVRKLRIHAIRVSTGAFHPRASRRRMVSARPTVSLVIGPGFPAGRIRRRAPRTSVFVDRAIGVPGIFSATVRAIETAPSDLIAMSLKLDAATEGKENRPKDADERQHII